MLFAWLESTFSNALHQNRMIIENSGVRTDNYFSQLAGVARFRFFNERLESLIIAQSLSRNKDENDL